MAEEKYSFLPLTTSLKYMYNIQIEYKLIFHWKVRIFWNIFTSWIVILKKKIYIYKYLYITLWISLLTESVRRKKKNKIYSLRQYGNLEAKSPTPSHNGISTKNKNFFKSVDLHCFLGIHSFRPLGKVLLFCTRSSSPCTSLSPIFKTFISFASDKRTTNDLKFSTIEKSVRISITNMSPSPSLLPKAARKAKWGYIYPYCNI